MTGPEWQPGEPLYGTNRPLSNGDELADFIRHWHWWQTQQETA